jgi:hypothetical protein
VTEIKGLRDDNQQLRAEVAGLRADSQRQTGDQIVAGARASSDSAQHIAAAVKSAGFARNSEVRVMPE